jgi:hypothetical protein
MCASAIGTTCQETPYLNMPSRVMTSRHYPPSSRAEVTDGHLTQ